MAAQQSIPPNQSLYVQNLPEKFQKDDLRRSLYMLFSTYGPILDVNAMKTSKMRGQAHILFRDVQSATQAMRACQGFDFFGREMRISYSKNTSDTLAKLTGTFGQPKAPQQEPQKQIGGPPAGFPAPPGKGGPPNTLPGPPSGLPPPPGLPQKVDGLVAPAPKQDEAASPQGVKRSRPESDEEDAAMDEDDDDEGAMEMSDSD